MEKLFKLVGLGKRVMLAALSRDTGSAFQDGHL